jgi:hypothetical protein
MIMRTYTHTSTWTRTEAVQDQFIMFLQYAAISDDQIERIVRGVQNKWLEAVGVYLVNGDGKRFLEIEIQVDWALHSDLIAVTPTITTDLPGWKERTAPEVRVLGHRFGVRARELGKPTRFWVRFVKDVRDDPTRYKELCGEVGVCYGTSAPEWSTPPGEKSYRIIDLNEVTAIGREA